jgi:hypothetical protein
LTAEAVAAQSGNSQTANEGQQARVSTDASATA